MVKSLQIPGREQPPKMKGWQLLQKFPAVAPTLLLKILKFFEVSPKMKVLRGDVIV